MQSSEFGRTLKVTVFGESHGDYVGADVTGLPAGIPLDTEKLRAFMKRRQGGAALTTPRKERDLPIFENGITEGQTDGSPLRIIIDNENKRSGDYAGFKDTPRPSHADFTAQMRYGDTVDLRGGGHFSARLTAPLCVLGYLCLEWLTTKGISIGAHLEQIGSVRDNRFDPVSVSPEDFRTILRHSLPVLSGDVCATMESEILVAAEEGDSVGGIVECAVTGIPAGIGDPLYDGIENVLAHNLFALGGVRGIEFGTGFAAAAMRGSCHNDPFRILDGKVVTATNHSGGIQGGITNGMPIIFRACFKPTASISKTQETVSLSRKENTTIQIHGRHDPCIAVRAVPCVEAMTAISLTDLLITEGKL